MDAPQPPGLISSAEAADVLSYTVQHVRRLVREGRLTGYKIGRDWLVSSESVQAYLGAKANLPLALEDPKS